MKLLWNFLKLLKLCLSETFMKLPESFIIIGACTIGMEFATVWNSYGVDVTVVEMLPHILPLEDDEAAKEVEKAFLKRGVKLLEGHKVESIAVDQKGVNVTVLFPQPEHLSPILCAPESVTISLEDTARKKTDIELC